jgi:hypothetical protein
MGTVTWRPSRTGRPDRLDKGCRLQGANENPITHQATSFIRRTEGREVRYSVRSIIHRNYSVHKIHFGAGTASKVLDVSLVSCSLLIFGSIFSSSLDGRGSWCEVRRGAREKTREARLAPSAAHSACQQKDHDRSSCPLLSPAPVLP